MWVFSYRFAMVGGGRKHSPQVPPLRATNTNAPWGSTHGAFVHFVNGGADGSRTRDLCIANAALYQLSYCPTGLPRFSARAKGRERPIERG